MSDEPELTPQEREVRRLLADARHDQPMPDEVVARLDRVLAGLAEEPARVAPVADLATRRRRAASLLVAAAAVLVVGIGLGQVGIPGGSSGGADESVAGREVVAPGAAQEDGAAHDEATSGSANESTPQSAEGAPANDAQDRREVLAMTDTTFGDQVADLQDAIRSTTSTYATKQWSRTRAAARACEAPSWGAGTFVPVRYDGYPAVLVFRRATGDTQVADLFLCGATEPERSITLPAA